jgi:hypothetical protein
MYTLACDGRREVYASGAPYRLTLEIVETGNLALGST